MIEFTLEDSIWCPLVFCDHCGEPIRKAVEGNVESQRLAPRPLFVHKHCLLAFENASGGAAGWIRGELTAFVLRLGIYLDMAETEGQGETSTWIVIREKLATGL